MKNNELNKMINNIPLKIHDEIYVRLNQHYVDVFLCGGASTLKYTSIRDKVREEIDKIKNIRILYPEDLFIEMLNKDKEYDLLSLERFLADNCDIICIICESAGSLVELGAFTNNESTVDKVIAVIDEKRRKDKSFIMLGPVKIIRKANKHNVVFYSVDNIDKLNEELTKLFNRNKINQIRAKKSVNKKTINTIIGLYYFIPLLLYFYNSLELSILIEILENLFRKKGFQLNDFDALFKSALKLLYKDKYINKNIITGNTTYSLTEKGYKEINKVLNSIDISNRTMLYDGIRFSIMKDRYYT